ncbi:hypothetical protein DEU56DRAFT_755026 [Suillus clintonianus]|uniref:uncharacterized protein n=1 Tax=Suillus clintonianus TaxID=1904413 RepID=UPI001B874C6E|nr:uncharacterized protein DEU56DRAFT_755026 [Suillus clintonianus]KAG2141323.1 hypothetical protein DEU56DRAFT_755026 [Suillus clintonianus]
MFTQQYLVNQEIRFQHPNSQMLGSYPLICTSTSFLSPCMHSPIEMCATRATFHTLPQPGAILGIPSHVLSCLSGTVEFTFLFSSPTPHPALELPSTYYNKHQFPQQHPSVELHPPYVNQLPSLGIQSNQPEPPCTLEPEYQQDQQPQYEVKFVHRDITFTGYGVPQCMWWDLGAAEAPRAEYSEQPRALGVINEYQTLLLAPESTPALSNVEAESSDSADSNSSEDQTNHKEGVAPTREKHAKTVRKALKVGQIAIVGQVKYRPFETRKVKEEMVSWMSNIRQLFKDYAIHNIQKDLSLHLPIEQQGAEVLHKKMLVLTLLNSLNFLHKFEYDNSGTLVCHMFEAEWFVNMIIDVIYLNGLYQYVTSTLCSASPGLQRITHSVASKKDDVKRRKYLFDTMETIPCVKRNWALKWISYQCSTFGEHLVAFAAIEGIFFSGNCTGIPPGTRGHTRTRTRQKPVPALGGTGFAAGIVISDPYPHPSGVYPRVPG